MRSVIFEVAGSGAFRSGQSLRPKRNYANIKTWAEFLLLRIQSTYDFPRIRGRLAIQGKTLGKFTPIASQEKE